VDRHADGGRERGAVQQIQRWVQAKEAQHNKSNDGCKQKRRSTTNRRERGTDQGIDESPKAMRRLDQSWKNRSKCRARRAGKTTTGPHSNPLSRGWLPRTLTMTRRVGAGAVGLLSAVPAKCGEENLEFSGPNCGYENGMWLLWV